MPYIHILRDRKPLSVAVTVTAVNPDGTYSASCGNEAWNGLRIPLYDDLDKAEIKPIDAFAKPPGQAVSDKLNALIEAMRKNATLQPVIETMDSALSSTSKEAG